MVRFFASEFFFKFNSKEVDLIVILLLIYFARNSATFEHLQQMSAKNINGRENLQNVVMFIVSR